MGAERQAIAHKPLYHSTAEANELHPNPWNPNVMDAEMFEKERASIREFGFVDPLTVRQVHDGYEIIDGEHRWRAGVLEGMGVFPIVILDVDDDTAKELTIVLNETRGKADDRRLADLVRDLAARRDQGYLERVMPIDPLKLRTMIMRTDQIDWTRLHEKREQLHKDKERWVEKIYRMPVAAAAVVDEAIGRVRSEEGFAHDWQALEMIAADSLAS